MVWWIGQELFELTIFRLDPELLEVRFPGWLEALRVSTLIEHRPLRPGDRRQSVDRAHQHFCRRSTRGTARNCPAVKPRLLVSDLDGTLLDRRLELDPRDIEAARRAQAVGTPMAIATGRMYRSGLPYAQQLETRLPLICYQGALIQELPQGAVAGAVMLRREVTSEVSLPVLELARERGYAVNVYQDDELLVDAVTADVDYYTSVAQVTPVVAKDPPLEERLLRGTTKLTVVVADPARFPKLMSEMSELVGHLAEVTSSLVGFCEITAKDVNKGAAVLWLCQHLAIDPEEVVAVGDAPNDLPMLQVVGHPVAVEGASKAVLEVAEWVTSGPGQGGLASVVSHYQLDRADVG